MQMKPKSYTPYLTSVVSLAFLFYFSPLNAQMKLQIPDNSHIYYAAFPDFPDFGGFEDEVSA
jgi:hypothetical protein